MPRGDKSESKLWFEDEKRPDFSLLRVKTVLICLNFIVEKRWNEKLDVVEKINRE